MYIKFSFCQVVSDLRRLRQEDHKYQIILKYKGRPGLKILFLSYISISLLFLRFFKLLVASSWIRFTVGKGHTIIYTGKKQETVLTVHRK